MKNTTSNLISNIRNEFAHRNDGDAARAKIARKYIRIMIANLRGAK
jgi:hypothetical protein